MKILYVADGRSPIAQNWIRHFVERGDDVYLASTFACSLDRSLAVRELEIIPVAFSELRKASQRPGTASARTVGLRTSLRQWFGPLTIRRAAQKLRHYIERVKPDVVHAMRIPYEGMMAADAYTGTPLIVSIWGNDFTFHGLSTRLMKHYTEWTMKVADGLHADCHRDVRLAREWGFGVDRPGLVAPGNGGIRRDIFFPPQSPVEQPVIINPRGFRPYVRNDVFFKAIPHVLVKHPNARFLFALMAGEPQVEEWVQELDIGHAVELLPSLQNNQMADVFRRAQLVASPSIHDGTPNSLLEGIACGCFPVAGDLESIREWITPGKNGSLFDSNDEHSIANAICTALGDKALRNQAADLNREIISTRAEYELNMNRAEGFYDKVTRSTRVQ
ncbi:MAG TPA: glycosyltransferase family 4 protein [Anaerolineales bacterium]|nr:glycosyltransferase family 4 protein [Anaerolineales bacterium]